jgi:hypothetical protein
MADQPYTEADVARLRHVIVMPSEVVPRAYDREPYPQWAARAILADLAEAGRLLPEGSAPTPTVIRLRRRTPEERLAYLTAKRDEMLREGIDPSMIELVDQLMESDRWSTDE